MAKTELGNKRVCPETGRKFYDLNRDPIVSPYTGKSYPVSFFDGSAEVEEEEEVEELEGEAETVETVSLEEADEEAAGNSDDDANLPDVDGDDDDIDLGDDDNDDTFLADDEEDGEEDVKGIVGGRGDGDEE